MSSSQSPSANRVSLSSQTSGGLIGNPSLNEIQRVYGLILSLQRERERETVEVSGKEELKFGGGDISATSKKKSLVDRKPSQFSTASVYSMKI